MPLLLGGKGKAAVAAAVEDSADDSSVKEREDVAALNATLRGELESNGMAINDAEAASFREKLKEAGFYAEWKGKYGDDAWAILEKAVGADLVGNGDHFIRQVFGDHRHRHTIHRRPCQPQRVKVETGQHQLPGLQRMLSR